NPIEIVPIDYRRRTAAGAMVWTAQSWIFRLAGRYDQPFDGDTFLPGWSDQIVGSIEKTLSFMGQPVILSLGYAYEDGAFQDQTPLSAADPFHRAVLAGVRLPLSDDLVVFAGGLVDTYKVSSFKNMNLSSYTHLNVQKKFLSH